MSLGDGSAKDPWLYRKAEASMKRLIGPSMVDVWGGKVIWRRWLQTSVMKESAKKR